MQKMTKVISLFALSLMSSLALAGDLMVENAWIREAPPGAMAMGGYMTLHNHDDADRMLVGASSPAFESIMLHRTVIDGTMAKMVHQHMVTIPANGSVTFEPNGYHLMMMKPKQALRAGDEVSVTLAFKDGESVEVTHQVRAGSGGMGGMSHNH
ncbi:MAG: copper chaperone PCu(A)C [Gammaproteobacteria bacterium]|nr:copper chaperone PCu(A)C [Gammaproteobacteria bacterium]